MTIVIPKNINNLILHKNSQADHNASNLITQKKQ